MKVNGGDSDDWYSSHLSPSYFLIFFPLHVVMIVVMIVMVVVVRGVVV